jgi:phosphoribosylglycinamide formyltransferase 1
VPAHHPLYALDAAGQQGRAAVRVEAARGPRHHPGEALTDPTDGQQTVGTRIAVLASGSGSNLQALLDAGDLGGTIVLVASDRSDARALERAATAGVDTAVVAPGDYPDRDAWDAALHACVAEAEPDLVVLAGFMRILSQRWVDTWPMLNTHPSLLPAFAGARAVEEALGHGVKVSGATVHFVVAEVDSGPIVAQEAVEVLPDDTAESLHERIKAVEHRLLPQAVRWFCEGRLDVSGRTVLIRPTR